MTGNGRFGSFREGHRLGWHGHVRGSCPRWAARNDAFASYGFAAIGLLTVLLPLLILPLLLRAAGPRRLPKGTKADFGGVIGAVWLPGFGAALSSIGYCAILAFSSLLYVDQGWHPIWLAFTAFGAALIVAHMFLGHLLDKFGGARIALIFVLVQAAGLLVMGFARDAITASAGAAIAGLGYSLVYPALGVEAVRSTSPESRGLAMGLYTAFLDVAMALGSPALGWVADRQGLNIVFTVSAGITLCTAPVAAALLARMRSIRG